MIEDEVGNAEPFGENEREKFDSDVERLGLDEGRAAVNGIVGDGEPIGLDAGGENAEAQIAERDLTAERGTEVRLDFGAEVVDVDEQREGEGDEEQGGDDDGGDFENVLAHTGANGLGLRRSKNRRCEPFSKRIGRGVPELRNSLSKGHGWDGSGVGRRGRSGSSNCGSV